jgi:hypothetical protein
MMLPRSRTLLALTLGLAATCSLAQVAKADPISYTTSGTVDTPPNGTANMIFFNGISVPTTLVSAKGIDLGQFQVSSLSSTTTQTYSNTPFQILVNSGGNKVAEIDGTLFGSVGPDAKAAPTYTVTKIVPFNGADGDPLFTITPPSVPMNLNTNLPSGSLMGGPPASTDLNFIATVPEPASVLVFAVSLGGLGLFARRRRAS